MTDAGLREPGQPPRATKELNLSSERVTDSSLEGAWPNSRGLQTLCLFHTAVTDSGLKELAALQRLQELDLSYTPVTDAGLKELAPLQALQVLDLSETAVTDAGLKDLAGKTQSG